jgi:hypothetical protein
VLLKVLDDVVDNLYVRVPLALRLADLLRVAAALGDEVVAVYPSMSVCVALRCRVQFLKEAVFNKGKDTHTSNMVQAFG